MRDRHIRLLLILLAGFFLCTLGACGRGLGSRPLQAVQLPQEAQAEVLPISIKGRVINTEGHGIPALALELEFTDVPVLGAHRGLEQADSRHCTTDAGGYFQVEVPSASNHLRLSVHIDGQRYFPWDPSSLEYSGTNLGAFFLPERRRIAGQIVDDKHQGRAGVSVRIAENLRSALLVPEGFGIHESDDYLWLAESKPNQLDWAKLGVIALTTDEEGRFSTEGYFVDPWVSWTDAKGLPHGQGCAYSRDWEDMMLGEHHLTEEHIPLHATKGVDLSKAEVIATVTTCLPDLQILSRQTIRPGMGLTIQTENPTGFDELGYRTGPSLGYRLHAQAPWVFRSSFWGGESALDLFFDAPQDLMVRLQDEEGNEIENATLQWAAPESMDPRQWNSKLALPEFTPQEPGTWRASQVPPGDLMAWIEAPGMAPGLAFWDPYPHDDRDPTWHREQTIALHRAPKPIFRVVMGPEKQPVAGFLIQVGPWVQWSDQEPKCEDHGHSYLGNRGLTDAEGRWSPAAVCSRGATIYVVYGGSVLPFTWDGTGGEHEIDLGEVATLSGTILSGGVPAPDLVLSLEPMDNDRQEVRVCTDSQGKFHLPMLAGEYQFEHGDFGDALWTSDGELVESLALEPGDAMELLLHAQQP